MYERLVIMMIKTMLMVTREMIMVMTMMLMTWEDVVSKGQRREICVRDVDCHKGKEVREGKQ